MKLERILVALAVVTVVALLPGTWPAIHGGRSLAEESPAAAKAASDSDDGDASATPATNDAIAASKPAKPVRKFPEPKGAKRLSREFDVWVDAKQKAVIVDGQVSLREGMLEMFACTRNTKEHEAIVSVNSKAYVIHAALLLVGAEPGRPAQFVPKYRPPSGTEIEVTVEWQDERGKLQTARAQDWILDINTKKPMAHPFVFAGSSFWTDEETGKKFYQAEGGDLICVSNFSTAMLDIPVESSPENSELAFEAYTKRIPPLGAPVRLILKPKLTKSAAAKEKTDDDNRDKQDAGAKEKNAGKASAKETENKGQSQ
jgi:hypothetical protein